MAAGSCGAMGGQDKCPCDQFEDGDDPRPEQLLVELDQVQDGPRFCRCGHSYEMHNSKSPEV